MRDTFFLLSIIVIFVFRLSLVALFLPFSAMDKVINTDAAMDQATSTVGNRSLAWVLVIAGIAVEVLMSLAILTGYFDRLGAFILAGYCGVTALLWKQFWNTDDFTLIGPSKGRDVFWDFMKNFALAGGFLILATGGTAAGLQQLVQHPLASSHPYATNLHEAGWQPVSSNEVNP